MPEITDIAEVMEQCLAMEDRFIKLLEELVTLETPPEDASAQRKLFAILERELDALGYKTMHIPGKVSGGQLYARPQKHNNGCYQMLLGHIDTVWPEGTIKKMPFTREEQILRGPGIYDMKAGIIMMILALHLIRERKETPQVAPVLFINSDEETGSRESVERIKYLARAMTRVYVLEPSLDPDGKIKTRRKGVGHFDVRIKGVSSHAGIEPERGRSAIVELSYIIQKLHALNDPEKGISINVGKIDGGISTNVVAPESSAAVDARVLTKKDAARIEKEIHAIEPSTPGVELEIEGGFKRPPLVQNQRNLELWQAAQQIGKELGLNLTEGTSGGGSDGSFTSIHTATLDGLGAVGDGAHSPIEHIRVEETLRRIALLVNLLLLPSSNRV